jgi:hypothetical protein
MNTPRSGVSRLSRVASGCSHPCAQLLAARHGGVGWDFYFADTPAAFAAQSRPLNLSPTQEISAREKDPFVGDSRP